MCGWVAGLLYVACAALGAAVERVVHACTPRKGAGLGPRLVGGQRGKEETSCQPSFTVEMLSIREITVHILLRIRKMRRESWQACIHCSLTWFDGFEAEIYECLFYMKGFMTKTS